MSPFRSMIGSSEILVSASHTHTPTQKYVQSPNKHAPLSPNREVSKEFGAVPLPKLNEASAGVTSVRV